MAFRKLISTLVVAGMLYWAPSVLPAVNLKLQTGAYACAASNTYTTWDTAFADCVTPIVAGNGHMASPWPVIVLIGGVVSIMLNAAIVWNAECRELTLGEAFTAGALPGVGIAINQSRGPKTACRH